MWIAENWKDYELLDCGDGEKLERWGRQILVRPDPQAIWDAQQCLAEPGCPLSPVQYRRRTLGAAQASGAVDGAVRRADVQC